MFMSRELLSEEMIERQINLTKHIYSYLVFFMASVIDSFVPLKHTVSVPCSLTPSPLVHPRVRRCQDCIDRARFAGAAAAAIVFSPERFPSLPRPSAPSSVRPSVLCAENRRRNLDRRFISRAAVQQVSFGVRACGHGHGAERAGRAGGGRGENESSLPLLDEVPMGVARCGIRHGEK